jgi:hypothetical protein
MACFSLVLVVVVLQMIPTFNFFFAFLEPARWSVLLVNLGFVLMAVDGFARGGGRWLRIAPVAWFGGYFVIAALSHALAWQFYSQLDRQNAAQKIAWNPANETIVLSHSWTDENRGVSFTAQHLVRGYRVAAAFDAPTTGAKDTAGYREVKIGLGDCPTGAMNGGPDGIAVSRSEGARVSFARGLCMSNSGAFAPASAVTFVNRGIVAGDLLLDRQVEPIDVSAPGGRSAHMEAGWTRPLTWFPAPIVGCDWPGFTPEPLWCGIRFDRESARDTGRTPEKVITSALGLSKASLDERFPGLVWEEPGFSPGSSKGRATAAPRR